MFCNKCGAELSNDSAFCHKCGSPVEVNEKLRCPKCGGYVEDSNQTYCDNCGANLKRDNEWRRSVKNDFKVENESVTFRSSSTPFNSKPAGNTTGAIMGIVMTTFMSFLINIMNITFMGIFVGSIFAIFPILMGLGMFISLKKSGVSKKVLILGAILLISAFIFSIIGIVYTSINGWF